MSNGRLAYAFLERLHSLEGSLTIFRFFPTTVDDVTTESDGLVWCGEGRSYVVFLGY